MACAVKAAPANELAFPFTTERAQQPLATNIKTQHIETVSNKWMRRPHPLEREREKRQKKDRGRGSTVGGKRQKINECSVYSHALCKWVICRASNKQIASVCLPPVLCLFCVRMRKYCMCLFWFSDLLLASFCFSPAPGRCAYLFLWVCAILCFFPLRACVFHFWSVCVPLSDSA